MSPRRAMPTGAEGCWLPHDERAARRARRGAWSTMAVLGCLLQAVRPPVASAAPAPVRAPVAVLGVEARDLAEPVGRRLKSAVEQALGRLPGLRLLASQTLEEFKLVFGCLDEQAACMARGGRQLGATRLLWGAVAPRGDQWRVRLVWFDVATAQTTSVVEVSMPSTAELETAVRALSPALRRLLGVRVGGLVLHLPVTETEVWVDGQRRVVGAGRVFSAAELPRGSHRVEVRKRGYLPWQREAQIGADQTTELVVSLPLAEVRAAPAGD